MSDCLLPYLVPTDDIRAVFGSKDGGLVGSIMTRYVARIPSLDEWAAGYYEDQSDEDEVERLTVAQALDRIVRGDLGDPDPLHYGSTHRLAVGLWP